MRKLLIVDNNQSFRKHVRYFLESAEIFKVIAEAGDGKSAIDYAVGQKPDIVLMDIGMSGMNGIEAGYIIHQKMPHIALIMLSAFDLDEYKEAALLAGADAYVVKKNMTIELLAVIEKCWNNKSPYGQSSQNA